MAKTPTPKPDTAPVEPAENPNPETAPVVDEVPAAVQDAPQAPAQPSGWLKATTTIIYGKGQRAEKDSFFVPVSASEREECLNGGIAVEPDEIEAIALGAAPTPAEDDSFND